MTTDAQRATKVHEFVNARTQIASPENRVQQLVREAVGSIVEYLEQPTNKFTGKDDVQGYGETLGLSKAVEIVTGHEITVADLAASARSEVARRAAE